MEFAADTKQVAKYSPTSTPVLDGLRPLPPRRWGRLSAGEYFFLSGAVILGIVAFPMFRRVAESLLPFGILTASLIACLLIPAAALLVATAAHEAGHLVVARLTGFRLTKSRLDSSERGQYAVAKRVFSCEGLRFGMVSLEPRRLEDLPRRLCLVSGAGPVASLLLALAVELYVLIAEPPLVPAFTWHVLAGSSFLLGVAELLPDAGRGNFSDGERILMLLRDDESAQRWISTLYSENALVRGEQPEAGTDASMAKAAGLDDDSRDAVNARWLGYLWANDRQDITAATKYLEENLTAPNFASARLRDRLFLEAAVFQAWFREDREKTLIWAGKIRSKKLTPWQQQRLQIALLWSEGRLFDAWEKMGAYFDALRGLPSSPARDRAERAAGEWKKQMESRMLTRAWRALYSMSRETELPEMVGATAASDSPEIASW